MTNRSGSHKPGDTTAASPPTVTCPTCGNPAAYSAENPSRPFCSERCRLIDLGAWASEGYRIADNTPPDGGIQPSSSTDTD